MKVDRNTPAGPAIFLTMALAVAGMLLPGHPSGALAATTAYSFSTGGSPFGNGPISEFSTASYVAGSFTYDAATPAFGPGSDGSTIYRSTATNLVVGTLSAVVNEISITDARGSAVNVGNNLAQVGSSPGPLDVLQLSFEPPIGAGTHDIVAPTFGSYTLVNIRMFWVQGISGAPDFLTNQNLPAALPLFQGRLALDFIPTGSSSTLPTASVFFDGLQVAAVPEPDIYVFMLSGLAVCVQIASRRNCRRA